MLSRSETLIKLIDIRKTIITNEEKIEKPPENYSKLKKDIDELLLDLTGVPDEGRHQVHEILNKAYAGEIKSKTAVVAIYEIYKEFQDEDTEKKSSSKEKNINEANNNSQNNLNRNELEELYKSGYR